MANNNVPVPAPKSPGLPIAIDPIQLVNGILDCYKNVTIAKEEQETLRTEIREKSRVYIAAIEANTKQFEMALAQKKDERMVLINSLCEVIRQKGVDEYSLKLCDRFLSYLERDNPMNLVGKTLKFLE